MLGRDPLSIVRGKREHPLATEHTEEVQHQAEPSGALMCAEPKTIASESLKSAVTVEPFSRRRIDRIDEPARPLGAKRAALQVRREKSAEKSKVSRNGSLEPGVLTLASNDETVAFTLRATALGLVIERTQRQASHRQAIGTRFVQVMVFADQPSFDRWCEFEPMRFGDALLYGHLRREGHAAFAAKE